MRETARQGGVHLVRTTGGPDGGSSTAQLDLTTAPGERNRVPRASAAQVDQQIAGMDAEQLPAGKHEQHGPGHFAGLYAAENVAGTEFIFGATFVVLGSP